MKKELLFGAVLSGTFLFSCGGGGDTPSTGTETPGGGNNVNVSGTFEGVREATDPIRQFSENLGQLGISRFFFPSFGGSSGVSAQSQDCSQLQSSGNQADADNDGIPVDVTYTFNCTFEDGTYSGTISAKDDDDSNPLSGFDVCTGTFGSSGCSRQPLNITSSYNVDFTLDVDIDLQGGTYVYTTFFAQSVYTLQGSSVSWTFNGDGFSYTPDNDGDNDPFDAGTYNGTISLTLSTTEGNFDITYQADNVHVGACPGGGADSGTLTISLTCPQGSAVATLTIKFNGCNSASGSVTSCDGTTTSF